MAARGAGLHAVWSDTSDALLEANANGISLAFAEGDKGLISFAGFRESLAGMELLTIAPAGAPAGVYSLVVRGEASVQVFLTFEAFADALVEQDALGARLHRVSGSGRWDQQTQTFTAKRAVLVVEPAES